MVQVTIAEGALRGELVKNEYGGTYYSFKGIPYAQPPVGDLRFKAPHPPKPWSGVRAATEFGSVCYQYYYIDDKVTGSEDCLYLNVYTPQIKSDKPLPVMFFIHGGALVWGSGNDDIYGPKFLVKNGVVLVTFNYILEALGFLCLDTEDIPGNAGMKDQVAALRWVNKNIDKFGGDPNNITIFGESAGASSVAYHCISPMTKGLFKRAILQSGATICSWARPVQPRERALAFARSLGFYSTDNKKLNDFFKSLPLEKLINVKPPLIFSEVFKVEIIFGVVNEKKFENNETFLHGNDILMLHNGIHEGVEIMGGYVENEGYIFLALIDDFEKKLHAANNFYEFFVPKFLALKCSINEQLEIGKRVKEFYVNNEILSKENVHELLKYIGLEMFSYGIITWLKICAKTNPNNVFMYKFTCKSERNICNELFRIKHYCGDKNIVCHFDDILYLFNSKWLDNSNVDMNIKSYEMVNTVTKLWTNFAKYGNPTPDDSMRVKWIPYTSEGQDYLNIGDTLIPEKVPESKDIQFFDEIFSNHIPEFVDTKPLKLSK